MNIITKARWCVILLLTIAWFSGCVKFLDQKPKVSQVVPHTPNDLQRLLDNSSKLNYQSATGFAELVSDDYYFRSSDWQKLENTGFFFYTQNYVWGPNPPSIDPWWGQVQVGPYPGPIYYSNIVLDNLPKISWEPKDSSWVKALKGSALFYRAFAFYNLAQVFCRPYDQQYLSGLGVVLRLTSDASVIDHHRATLGETYTKIIVDLKEAVSLLPVTTTFPTRPCQAAAYAALARVYLSMRDYTNSAYYANLALQQKSALLDYNTRIPVANPSFAIFNPEVIFDACSPSASVVYFLSNGDARIDTLLYRSYDNNDLRKVLFFFPRIDRGNDYYFKGSYNSKANNNGTDAIFDGLATDELYLIRAECSARAGNKDSAMADLNKLLRNRWKTGTYTDMTATNAADALSKIFVERRKELIWRGQRWMDVRRLNLEGANIIMKRNINGTIYTLTPNSLRTVMPIPQAEINRSGIEQNPR